MWTATNIQGRTRKSCQVGIWPTRHPPSAGAVGNRICRFLSLAPKTLAIPRPEALFWIIMRDFRLTGLAVLSVVAAAVVAFLLAYLAGQNRTAPPRQQAGASSPAGADKDNAAASAKSTARILAPTTVNYYRVKVALDSTLRTDKHTFHLYAADVPGREGTCTYRDGRRWAVSAKQTPRSCDRLAGVEIKELAG